MPTRSLWYLPAFIHLSNTAAQALAFRLFERWSNRMTVTSGLKARLGAARRLPYCCPAWRKIGRSEYNHALLLYWFITASSHTWASIYLSYLHSSTACDFSSDGSPYS